MEESLALSTTVERWSGKVRPALRFINATPNPCAASRDYKQVEVLSSQVFTAFNNNYTQDTMGSKAVPVITKSFFLYQSNHQVT